MRDLNKIIEIELHTHTRRKSKFHFFSIVVSSNKEKKPVLPKNSMSLEILIIMFTFNKYYATLFLSKSFLEIILSFVIYKDDIVGDSGEQRSKLIVVDAARPQVKQVVFGVFGET